MKFPSEAQKTCLSHHPQETKNPCSSLNPSFTSGTKGHRQMDKTRVCNSLSLLCSQASMDIPGLNLSQQEYYPYVYYKIDCNLLDFKV